MSADLVLFHDGVVDGVQSELGVFLRGNGLSAVIVLGFQRGGQVAQSLVAGVRDEGLGLGAYRTIDGGEIIVVEAGSVAGAGRRRIAVGRTAPVPFHFR